MPVVLDPDAAAVYKAFQEAGRPAYETLTAPEAREYYLNARFVSNPEPPELADVKPLSIEPGQHIVQIFPTVPRPGNHAHGWLTARLDTTDALASDNVAYAVLPVAGVAGAGAGGRPGRKPVRH